MKKFILFFVLLLIFLSTLLLVTNTLLIKKNTDSIGESNDDVNNSTESATILPSIYKDYDVQDFDSAQKEKRVIVLYFTSNWCEECNILSQDLENLFKSSEISGAVAFRVHILDSETTTQTDALAQKFDVTKEMSIVILDKNGVVFNKLIGSNIEVIKSEIKKVGDIK